MTTAGGHPNENLFVLGAQKTATSTLVGLLNASPDVFLLYEADLLRQGNRRDDRVARFVAAYPHLESLFQAASPDAYRRLREAFPGFRYVGDKLPGFLDLAPFEGAKVVFTVRDLRSWLCKDKVQRKYFIDGSPARTAVAYVTYFLEALRRLDAPCVVRMEDLLQQPEAVVGALGAYLGIDAAPMAGWWTKVGGYAADDPKAHWTWWEEHPSALVPPGREDVVAVPAPHPFWDEVLPVFDKYYRGDYRPEEIDADLRTLEGAGRRRVDLAALYEAYETNPVAAPVGPAGGSVRGLLRRSGRFLRRFV